MPVTRRLYCEEVDVGEAEPRQIGSGIRAFHTFEEMQGHRVCVLCERVTFAGYEGEAATPAQVQKKKYLEACSPVRAGRRTDG